MKILTRCEGSASLGSQTLGTPSHQYSHCCLNNIDDLPPCLLVEILCRLPCKFVIRCKCVCKSWSTLISNPDFDSRRALFLRNNNCVDNVQVPLFANLCGYIPCKPELYTIKYSHSQMKIKPLDLGRLISLAQLNEVVVAATYSDLILFCRRADSCYYICNPFTKQWVFIPPPPPRHLLLIANEGFGFDLDNKCCKVVRILGYSIQIGYPLMVDIFSFETGKWIESDLVLQGTKPDHVYYRQYIDRQTSPVAHNGTLYWITLEGHLIGLEVFRNTNCRIRGRFIYNPNYLCTSYLNRGSTLCVYQGSVRVGHLYEKPASTVCLYISELKEDDDDEVDGGGIISKLCFKELVDLQPCITSFPTMGDSHHLLAFDPKDEDIVYLRHGNSYNYPAAILRCNIRNKLTISHISNNSPSSNSNYLFKSFSFVLPRWRWPTPVPQLN